MMKTNLLRATVAGAVLLLAGVAFAATGTSSLYAALAGLTPVSAGKGTTLNAPAVQQVSAQAFALALQSDGKAIAVGSSQSLYSLASVARYNTNGQLDTSFGREGTMLYSLRNQIDNSGDEHVARAVAIQSDGKIVVGGGPVTSQGGSDDFYLLRLNSDGNLDESFGLGGRTQDKISTSSGEQLTSLTIQPDGKIVAAGYQRLTIDETIVILARYNPNGTFDASFGVGGVVSTVRERDTENFAEDIVLQPDGKIVVAGRKATITPDTSTSNFRLWRFHPDGSPDTSFGPGGVVTTAWQTTTGAAYALALQTDGKLIAAGSGRGANSTDFALARYNTDGSLDSDFGTGGQVTTEMNSSQSDAVRSIQIQSDGRIVVAGYTGPAGPDQDSALARYTADGELDSSFDNDGKVVTTVTTSSRDLAEAVVIQQDGKILTAGWATKPVDGAFELYYALARYNSNGSLDASFDNDGIVLTRFPAYPAGDQQFADVDHTSPFYPYISCMAERNIISGYACGGPGEACVDNKPYFRPNNSMTRGQVAKIVANAAGYADTPTNQTFQDVPPDSPFYAFIERMAERNIISGYACGGPGEECVAPDNRPYFHPIANVSRGQLTKIVSNARGYSDKPAGQTFEDVTPSNAFYVFVERLVARGVMSGYACGGPGEPCQAGNRGYFRPGVDVTRGQASKIVGNSFFPNCQPAASAR